MHFESAPLERNEIVHLVQFVDFGTDLLREIEIVRREFVLGVMAAADTAVSARDAAIAPWSDTAEVWIVGLHAGLPK